MIPAQAALSMIHNAKHGPIDQAYEKVMEDRAQKHMQEIEEGAIRTWIGILCVKVIELQRDAIYLIL
jgi:hypothetical protein